MVLVMLARRVAVVAATLTIAVSGWAGVSFRNSPTDSTASSPAAPALTTTTTVWVADPLMIEPLAADRHASEVSIPPVPSLPPGITLSPSTTTTTTTTTLPDIDDARCPEVWPIAVDTGWPVEWLPTLDEIVWAESRCQHDVVSRTYDYGLLQINWAAHGDRLLSQGIHQEILLDPEINLEQGLWIAQYADEHYACWSQPWYMSGDWCA